MMQFAGEPHVAKRPPIVVKISREVVRKLWKTLVTSHDALMTSKNFPMTSQEASVVR